MTSAGITCRTAMRHPFPPAGGDGRLRALTGPRGTGLAAFTLIELMVVIGIIALLLAIALPTASRLLDNQNRNSTMSNMQVIENAIDAYRRCKTNVGRLPPEGFSIKDLNPGPRESFTDSNNDARWSGEPPDSLQNDDGDNWYYGVNIRDSIPGISRKASFRPVWRLPADTGDDYNSSSYDRDGDYKDIESLYLYITQLCPEGRQLLESLPAKRITNKDRCGTSECSDMVVFDSNADDQNSLPFNTPGKDKAVDLVEIRDEWGNPLRYRTFSYGIAGAGNARWELRSAGPDEQFSAAFSSEEKSGDDVVVSGE